MSPELHELVARERDALRHVARVMKTAAAELGPDSRVAEVLEAKAERLFDCAARRERPLSEGSQ